jgi:hypothetical protein
MSMGWGKVTQDEWKAAKEQGFGSDDVPDGDYAIQIGGFRQIDPSKNKRGIGTIFVTGLTTELNESEYQNKKLELKFMYHPAPKEDGLKQMNAISLQNAISLIEACNVDPLTDATGHLDVEGTLKLLPTLSPVVMVTVNKDKQGYVNVSKPRPVS